MDDLVLRDRSGHAGPAFRRSVVLALAIGTFATGAVAAPAPDPAELWQRSLAAQRFPDLQSDATLTTVLASGDTVTLQVRLLAKIAADGTSRMAITRVASGGPLRGSTFLNVEHPKASDDLWVLLPAVATPRRLVSTNLADSYLGSEFRYGDLVQADPDEHTVTLRGEEPVEGEPCWVIEAVPREARLVRDTGLSKQVLWLRRSTLVERRVEQYDRRGALLKVMDVTRVFTDTESGRHFGSERSIRNVQSRAVSKVLFENIEVNRAIPGEVFTPVHMNEGSG